MLRRAIWRASSASRINSNHANTLDGFSLPSREHCAQPNSLLLYKMPLAAFLSSVFITGTLAATAAVVNFANNTGAPEHLASGTLYGLPENGNQIPVS